MSTDHVCRERRECSTDQLVIDAAIALADTGPYHTLSVAAVAAHAGVAEAGIKQRWPTRAHLVLDAFLVHTSHLEVPDTGSLRGDLEDLTEQNARLFVRSRDRNLTIAALAACAELGLDHRGINQPRRAAIEQIFARAAERGEVPAHLDPTLTTQLLAGAVLYRSTILNEPVDEIIAQRLVAAVLPFEASEAG